MRCIKQGNKKSDQVWKGSCRQCKAKFIAERSELKVSRCQREGYEFAHADCSECGAKSGLAVVLYPDV